MATIRINPANTFRRGIRACREGNWREGHTELTRLAQQEERHHKLPGLFYSYLGQAMARCEGRRREGLDLCLHAVEQEPFQPENYLNLAEVYLLLRNRRGALRALNKGLHLDPDHTRLLEVGRTLGLRRKPPIRFLERGNPLNRFLGLLSSRLRAGFRVRRNPEDDGGEDFWGTQHRREQRPPTSN